MASGGRDGRDGRGPNDTNAQIITTDAGRIYKPKDLLSAISEIQQFYVIESKGQNIPAEFLTLEVTRGRVTRGRVWTMDNE